MGDLSTLERYNSHKGAFYTSFVAESNLIDHLEEEDATFRAEGKPA